MMPYEISQSLFSFRRYNYTQKKWERLDISKIGFKAEIDSKEADEVTEWMPFTGKYADTRRLYTGDILKFEGNKKTNYMVIIWNRKKAKFSAQQVGCPNQKLPLDQIDLDNHTYVGNIIDNSKLLHTYE